MKRIFSLLMLFISVFSLCSCDKNKTEVPLKVEIEDSMNEYIDSLMKNTLVYIPSWNKESFKGKWNYIDGVFLNSIVNLYKDTGNEKYKNFFLKFINYYVDEKGVQNYLYVSGQRVIDIFSSTKTFAKLLVE